MSNSRSHLRGVDSTYKEPAAGLDRDGGGPHDPNMEARVAKLETTCQDLRESVAVMRSNYSTKADIASVGKDISDVRTEMARVEATIIKWLIGTVLATGGLAFAAARFLSG